MRERWARNLAMLTGLLVVLLAAVFALVQNSSQQLGHDYLASIAQPQPGVLDDAERQALIASGRKVYEDQRCARCHAIAGEGNPRNALDGIGQKRSPNSIRQWIVASAELEEKLSPSVFRTKQRFGSLSEEELDALVAYLQNPSNGVD